MSDKSAIEWTEATWNPVTGCDRISPGCAHCYALTMAARLKAMGKPRYQTDGGRASGPGFGVMLHHDLLSLPLSWRKPRLVFVNSMSDLFHEEVPDWFLQQMWEIMAICNRHTFQILTKRPQRMRDWLMKNASPPPRSVGPWPLPNVWLGVSAENQRWAEERVPLLLKTPAAVRFLSCEPLLGPVELRPWLVPPVMWRRKGNPSAATKAAILEVSKAAARKLGWSGLDWVIAGGESAGPEHRRLVERCEGPLTIIGRPKCGRPNRHTPCNGTGWRPKPQALEWVRSIRDQCVAAGVAFFFKQWGGSRPKSAGRLLDGREWSEIPEVR